jgi:hypothetical protein
MKKIFKLLTVFTLSIILLASIIPLNSSFASSASYSFPSVPPDGNLSNTPLAGSQTPKIVNFDDKVYVVWRDGNNIFFVNSTDNGNNFPNPIGIGNATTTPSGNPQIATEGNNVFSVWRDNKDIKFNRSTDNGINFLSSEIILSSNTNSLISTEPQIALSDDSSSNPDDVYLIWRDIDSGDNDIIFARSSDNGTSFDSLKSVGASNTNFASPQIATVGDKVYVIWQTGSDILFKKSNNNGLSFSTTLDIGNSSGSKSTEKSYPQLTGTGNFVYAVWQDKTDIKFAYSSNGGDTFGSAQDIGNTAGTSVPGTPQIKAQGNNVYIVWRDDTGGNDDIKFIKSSDNGASFSSEINLSSNDGVSTGPSLYVTGSNVVVAWSDSTSGNNEILSKISTNDGVSFGSVENISSNSGNSKEPSITMSGGKTVVAWTDSTTGDNEILIKIGVVSTTSILFDQTQYKLSDSAQITIVDSSASGLGSISTTVTSTTDPSGISIDLTEGPLGTFSGTVSFTELGSSSGNIVKASTNDSITATYDGSQGLSSIFSRTVNFDGAASIDLGFFVHPKVIDQNANLNASQHDRVEIIITSSANLEGVSLVLNETGVDTGIFGGNSGATKSNLVFSETSGVVPIDLTESITITQIDGDNEGGSNTNATGIDKIPVKIYSNSDPVGISFNLTETGVNSAIFVGDLNISTTSSSNETGTILVSPGDFIDVANRDARNSKLLVTPASPQDGVLQVTTPSDSNITATYKEASDTIILFDTQAPGGGGGGLVRPSLVVNALGGLGGGGSAYSSPTLQLGNLVLLGQIDVPLEVEQMVLNHDSTVPAEPLDLGLYENFDYPLVIDDKGFILSGYSTTLETQKLKTNVPHTIKFLFYESDRIQHFSLYTNLRDSNTAIHQSDTQILYNYEQEIQVVDPNGFFESVSFDLVEIDDLKKEITLEITFAKPMETSDIIIRSWDPFLNSFDTFILDAIEIVPEVEEESPIPTYEEPVIEELKSNNIPIWIKNNAAWWADQQISDEDFVAGIEYLIKNEIIKIQGVEPTTSSSTTQIPDWIQNNAGWWGDSLITDGEFVEAMQWLITNGVIQI